MKLSTILLMGMMMLGLNSYAQPGQGMKKMDGSCCQKGDAKCMEIPNLTDDQKAKIETMKVANQKEMLTFKNQMGELKAKERTLATAEKPDTKAINANIDEITKLQNQMMKKRAQHHQDVRALLNDEQKLWFDTNMGKGHGKGDGAKGRHGMHQGMGQQRDSTNCPRK